MIVSSEVKMKNLKIRNINIYLILLSSKMGTFKQEKTFFITLGLGKIEIIKFPNNFINSRVSPN
jgi:hypothetical protein